MEKYSTKPLSLFKLIGTSLRAYPAIFPSIFLLVLLTASLHLIIPWILLNNIVIGSVILLAYILITWFLFTAVLALADSVLRDGKAMTFKSAFAVARQRFLIVLASNIVFFAIGLFLILFEYALDLMFDLVHQYPLFVVVSVLINVIVFVLLYFAIPLIIIDRMRIFAAFERSVKIVRGNWWRTFIVLAFIGAIILGFEALGILFTGQQRMALFTFFHFFMEFIFYPLIVATTLVLLNDLKLRFAAKTQTQEAQVHA